VSRTPPAPPYPRTISSPDCADPPVRPAGKAHRPHGAIERVTHPETCPREFRSGSPRPSPRRRRRRMPAPPTRDRARPQTTWQPRRWQTCGLLTRKVRDSPAHKPGGLPRSRQTAQEATRSGDSDVRHAVRQRKKQQVTSAVSDTNHEPLQKQHTSLTRTISVEGLFAEVTVAVLRRQPEHTRLALRLRQRPGRASQENRERSTPCRRAQRAPPS
jgi:hypothetical protein